MSVKVIETKRSRAERFLASLAESVPGSKQVVATEDISATAQMVAEYFSSRVAEGDLDSILQVLDDTLKHAKDARPVTSGVGAARDEEVDPSYYCG
jgi:hypothetical protein